MEIHPVRDALMHAGRDGRKGMAKKEHYVGMRTSLTIVSHYRLTTHY
jgi:hypothetical protein